MRLVVVRDLQKQSFINVENLYFKEGAIKMMLSDTIDMKWGKLRGCYLRK